MLYLHPDREYSLTEAAALIGVSVKTVHAEASRLVVAGFVADSRRGNVRLLRAVTGTPVSRPLTDLLAVTYGPLPVLAELLAGQPGVCAAFIYGSWAARYSGEPGPVPGDVDLLVVGTAEDDLDDVARAAQERLGRPVNVRRVAPAAWADTEPGSAFLASVRQRPLVELPLASRQGQLAWGGSRAGPGLTACWQTLSKAPCTRHRTRTQILLHLAPRSGSPSLSCCS